MARKSYSAEQIINHLRQAEILNSQGRSVRETSRQIGVTGQTCYRWRKEYGGMDVSQARRLKDLERENQRLKKLAADQARQQLGGSQKQPKRGRLCLNDGSCVRLRPEHRNHVWTYGFVIDLMDNGPEFVAKAVRE